MVFEPPIAGFAKAAGETTRMTLDRGALAGRAFDVRFDVCGNPCCSCGALGFRCRRVAAPGGAGSGTAADAQELLFDLDVFDRRIGDEREVSRDALALARGVVDGMNEAEWQGLKRLFLAEKRRQMENMDLDKLDVRFPEELAAGGAPMIGYTEIFPWAEGFPFDLGEGRWFADDLYCVRPDCDCTETLLAFYPIPGKVPKKPKPVRESAAVRYDYSNGKIEVLESAPGSLPARELIQALCASHPGFERLLQTRHRQLQRLARRHLASDGGDRPARPAAVPAKPRRNDPCPCGSGLKYKRCCGKSLRV